MWSLGCIIAELYNGKPLFPGTDENEMVEFQYLISGTFPQSMIDKGKKRDRFFNVRNGYKIIRSKHSRLLNLSKNSINLSQIVFRHKSSSEMGKLKKLEGELSQDEKNMVDFIRRCIEIDPKRRLTCEEAIRHDWFKDLLVQREREISESY